jgi:hypothetical protein
MHITNATITAASAQLLTDRFMLASPLFAQLLSLPNFSGV